MQNNLVTIGIPTYNRCTLLDASITSALTQSHTNIEVIVCDNASTDGTHDVCLKWEATDKRFKWHRQTSNIGPVGNFNSLTALAKGHYFMWLADDDRISPNYIEECLTILEGDASVVLASGLATFLHPDGRCQNGISLRATSSNRWLRVFKYLFLVRDNSGFYGLMRTDLAQDMKMKPMLAGDWLWVMGLSFLGKIKVAEKAMLTRSGDGESADFDRLMQSNGYTPLQRAFPYLNIACSVRAEILTNPLYIRFTQVPERLIGSLLAACASALGQGVFWRSVSFLSRVLNKFGNNRLGNSLRRVVRSVMGI